MVAEDERKEGEIGEEEEEKEEGPADYLYQLSPGTEEGDREGKTEE